MTRSGRVDARRLCAGRIAGPLEGRGSTVTWLASRPEWLNSIVATAEIKEGSKWIHNPAPPIVNSTHTGAGVSLLQYIFRKTDGGMLSLSPKR